MVQMKIQVLHHITCVISIMSDHLFHFTFSLSTHTLSRSALFSFLSFSFSLRTSFAMDLCVCSQELTCQKENDMLSAQSASAMANKQPVFHKWIC